MQNISGTYKCRATGHGVVTREVVVKVNCKCSSVQGWAEQDRGGEPGSVLMSSYCSPYRLPPE